MRDREGERERETDSVTEGVCLVSSKQGGAGAVNEEKYRPL